MRDVTLFCLISILAVFTGCDDAIFDPFENQENYYTVYGYLDHLETNHAIRVIPVTRLPSRVTDPTSANADLDATVKTIESGTGNEVIWRHSLEQLEDGSYGHIFRASFRVVAGRSYRLEITRSDGIMTHAETRVPRLDNPVLFERGPVVYNTDSTDISQFIHIQEIASPWNIQAIYLWGGGPINRRVYIPYERRGERTSDGGWDVTLDITTDIQMVMDDIKNSRDIGALDSSAGAALTAMGLQIRVLDANWDPPAGIFDPDLLIEPETVSNVVNGYGFFGSVGLYIQEWNVCELSVPFGFDRPTPTAGCQPGIQMSLESD